jgi:hypothetical protein
MRASELDDGYPDACQAARRLQTIIAAQDGLRNHCRTERRDASAAPAAFETVDARPFADIVAVSRAALEKLLLVRLTTSRRTGSFRALHNGRTIRTWSPALSNRPSSIATKNRQVEGRVIRRNLNGWPDWL